MNYAVQPGSDYIAFRAHNGHYLTCDWFGQVSSNNTSVSFTEMFIPERVSGSIITLRSFFGGYLAIYADGSVDCSPRIIQAENQFNVSLAQGRCTTDPARYVIIENSNPSNQYYLNIDYSGVSTTANIDSMHNLFSGYFDNLQSSCDNQEQVINANTSNVTGGSQIQSPENSSQAMNLGEYLLEYIETHPPS